MSLFHFLCASVACRMQERERRRNGKKGEQHARRRDLPPIRKIISRSYSGRSRHGVIEQRAHVVALCIQSQQEGQDDCGNSGTLGFDTESSRCRWSESDVDVGDELPRGKIKFTTTPVLSEISRFPRYIACVDCGSKEIFPAAGLIKQRSHRS